MDARDIILRIVQLKPRLGRTQLMKLVYLFDLAHVQLTGQPSTGLSYQWRYFGPHCEEFDHAEWDLLREGKITLEVVRTSLGRDFMPHIALVKERPTLPSHAEKILQYLVDHYGHLNTQELCDFVYRTPPMLEAKARNNQFGEPLDLRTREGAPPELYDHQVVEGILNADDEGVVPFEDAWARFEASVVAGGR